jgi:hypothetical protein
MHRAEWRQVLAAASDFIHRNVHGTASNRREGTQRQHETSGYLHKLTSYKCQHTVVFLDGVRA